MGHGEMERQLHYRVSVEGTAMLLRATPGFLKRYPIASGGLDMTLGQTVVSISPPGAEIRLLAPPTQARCVSLMLVVQWGQ